MTMQKLDLKYRPQRFADLVGQRVPRQYLSHLVAAGKGRHVLLEGPTGCGKTSAARIYGRALNCTERAPGASEPCNSCEHCQLQLAESFPDYREQSTGVEGGKEAILDLLDSARTKPLHGQYRVLVLDEAQAMTRAAFETLKRIMEEPPPFLVVILTTTDAGKILKDIRDRCASLAFRRVAQADAVAHLTSICTAEGLQSEPSALNLIAFLADGHLRPLVSRLDQLADFGDISMENARLLFNLGYVEHLPKLWLTLLTASLPATLDVLRGWEDDPDRIINLCREFVLWLQCRAAGAGDATINPAFAAIPTAAVRAIEAKLTEKAKAAGLTLDDAFVALGRGLGMTAVANPLLLQLVLRDLHNLTHRQGFDLGRIGAPVHEVRAAAPTAAGKPAGAPRRQFSAGYRVDERGVAKPVDTAPAPAPATPAFTLAPAVGLPLGAPPAFAAPPSAEVSIAPRQPPPPATPAEPEPDPEEKPPPGTTGGAFQFAVPQLPPRKPLYPHDLTVQHGWKTVDESPKAIFHNIPVESG